MMLASVRRSIARRLVVVFAGLWLYAALSPCLMADDTHCPDCPPASAMTHTDETACAPAMTADCALPDLNPVSLDWSADIRAPVAVLAIVAVAAMAALIPPFERHSENAALRAPPPLASRPAVLLI